MKANTEASMGRRLPACVFLLSLSAALPLQAAEAEDRAPDAARPASAEQPARSEESNSGDRSQGADVFIPTEEISEDFAVSFPVDI